MKAFVAAFGVAVVCCQTETTQVSTSAGGAPAVKGIDCGGDHAKFVQWAHRRADRDLSSFVEWVLQRGLISPADEVNAPFHAWGYDMGSECKPGEPTPSSQVCWGVHRGFGDWLALMAWKYDEPAISYVEYGGFAKMPFKCDLVRASELGNWGPDPETGWVNRLCSATEFEILIEQRTRDQGCGYVPTRIQIFSNRFAVFDQNAAAILKLSRERAGL